MRLSDRVYKYLNKLSRDSQFAFSDHEKLVAYMKNQQIEPYESIINFQIEFSGFELTITNHPGSSFYTHLFSNKDILEQLPIDSIEIDNERYFFFGHHATAQFWFVLGAQGQICTYDNTSETVNTISSCFEKFIEDYALEDFFEQTGRYRYPFHHDIIDLAAFDEIANGLLYLPEHSDDYNQWFAFDNLFVRKRSWFDRAGFSISLFCDTEIQCNDFIDFLRSRGVIG
jgi:hypothetical protein